MLVATVRACVLVCPHAAARLSLLALSVFFTHLCPGQVAQPLRAALTGSNASPGIYEVLWVLGKEACVARMQVLRPRGGGGWPRVGCGVWSVGVRFGVWG
jgi:hypothetical protein